MDKPRWQHFTPKSKGDEFLYQCGDVDVWITELKDSFGKPQSWMVTARWGDNGKDPNAFCYIETIGHLEGQSKHFPQLLPLLMRAKLTGKYP